MISSFLRRQSLSIRFPRGNRGTIDPMARQSPGDCTRAPRNPGAVIAAIKEQGKEEDERGGKKKHEEEGKEGGRKREISNYRDFLFRNSIPNTIVLASRAVDRTLIPPRSPIVSLETFRNRSLSAR